MEFFRDKTIEKKNVAKELVQERFRLSFPVYFYKDFYLEVNRVPTEVTLASEVNGLVLVSLPEDLRHLQSTLG